MTDENGDRPLKEEVDEIRVHFQSEIDSIKSRLETLERGAATKSDEQADENETKSPNFVPSTFQHSTPIAEEPKEANGAPERLTDEEDGQEVKQHVDREEQREAASTSANALLNQTANSFTLPRVFDDAQLSFSLQPEDRKDERSLRLNVTEEDSSSPANAEQKPPAAVERPAASTSTAPASPSSFQMKRPRTREEKLAALARIQQAYMPVKPVENTPPTNVPDQTQYTNQPAGVPYGLNQSNGFPSFPYPQQQQADGGHVPPQGPFEFMRSPFAQLNYESFNRSADTRSFHLPPGQENIFTPPTTHRPPMPPKPGDRLWFPPNTPITLTGIPLTPAYTTKPNESSTRTPERTRESGRERKEKASGSRKGRGKWAELDESSSSEDDSTTSSSRSLSPVGAPTCCSKHSARGHRVTDSLRTARGHDSIAHGYRASLERYAPNPRAHREHTAVSSRSTPHRPPPPPSRHTHRNEVDELLHEVIRKPQRFAGELKRLLEDPVVFRMFDGKRKVDDWDVVNARLSR